MKYRFHSRVGVSLGCLCVAAVLGASVVAACTPDASTAAGASSAPGDEAHSDAATGEAPPLADASTSAADAAADAVDAWKAPYPLPGAGQVLPIPTAGRNVADDVKPAPHDDDSWQYALFRSYGGGTFAADYSPAGAYVLAGMGGHGASPCFGAAIFDFTTGMWSYLPNGNGFDEARTSDVDRSTETSSAPYLELTNVTKPEMPAPAHNYLLSIAPPRSVLGGPKGAIVRTVGAAQTTNGWDSPQSHKLDLATGVWSRAATNLVTTIDSRTPYTDTSAAYDPVTKRIYFVLGDHANTTNLPYLDLVSATWKSAGSFTEPLGTGYASTAFVDAERRLLLVIRGSGQLWAINLDNVAAGWVELAVSGTVPASATRWSLYPTPDGGDGSFYAFSGKGPIYGAPPSPKATLQALFKLKPPAANPLTSTWEFSTVPIAGGITAAYETDPGSGAQHHSRFFYVPALRSFAWIPNGSDPVELIRP